MNSHTTSSRFVFSLLAPLLMFAPVAAADPVTFIFGGTASGTLGSSNFTNQAYTFTFLGDTANVASGFGGMYDPTTGTFSIANTGSGAITPQVDVFAAGGFATFFAVNGGNYVALNQPTIGVTVLSNSFGPVVATSSYLQNQTVSTALGSLNFSGLRGPQTFQSIVMA